LYISPSTCITKTEPGVGNYGKKQKVVICRVVHKNNYWYFLLAEKFKLLKLRLLVEALNTERCCLGNCWLLTVEGLQSSMCQLKEHLAMILKGCIAECISPIKQSKLSFSGDKLLPYLLANKFSNLTMFFISPSM